MARVPHQGDPHPSEHDPEIPEPRRGHDRSMQDDNDNGNGDDKNGGNGGNNR